MPGELELSVRLDEGISGVHDNSTKEILDWFVYRLEVEGGYQYCFRTECVPSFLGCEMMPVRKSLNFMVDVIARIEKRHAGDDLYQDLIFAIVNSYARDIWRCEQCNGFLCEEQAYSGTVMLKRAVNYFCDYVNDHYSTDGAVSMCRSFLWGYVESELSEKDLWIDVAFCHVLIHFRRLLRGLEEQDRRTSENAYLYLINSDRDPETIPPLPSY